MGATTVMEQPEMKVITVRIPVILASRMDSAVTKRKAEFPKFSMNDWVLEAIREKVDGLAIVLQSVPAAIGGISTMTIPGVQGGVGGGTSDFWQKWGMESKRLDPEARDQSFREALAERCALGLQLPKAWNKWSTEFRLSWLRSNDHQEGL